jgi:hypothetical protein
MGTVEIRQCCDFAETVVRVLETTKDMEIRRCARRDESVGGEGNDDADPGDARPGQVAQGGDARLEAE